MLVSYVGGGDDYTAIVNECKFDYNKVGTSMLTAGFDLVSNRRPAQRRLVRRAPRNWG